MSYDYKNLAVQQIMQYLVLNIPQFCS